MSDIMNVDQRFGCIRRDVGGRSPDTSVGMREGQSSGSILFLFPKVFHFFIHLLVFYIVFFSVGRDQLITQIIEVYWMAIPNCINCFIICKITSIHPLLKELFLLLVHLEFDFDGFHLCF